jgi:hypothetical protein
MVNPAPVPLCLRKYYTLNAPGMIPESSDREGGVQLQKDKNHFQKFKKKIKTHGHSDARSNVYYHILYPAWKTKTVAYI